MNFYLTGSEPEGRHLSASVPEKYRQYLLAGSRHYFMDSPAGAALLQEMKGLDYQLRYDLVLAGESLGLAFTVAAKCVVLLFVLSGSITFLDAAAGSVRLEGGRYYLCYIAPSCKHVVQFAAGRCVSVQIDIADAVSSHAGDYPLLSELRRHMDNSSFRGVFCAAPGNIDYRMHRLIDTLIKSRGTQWEMELAVQATASGLIKLFVEQLEEAGKDLPKHEVKKLEAVRKYICANIGQQLRMELLARIYGGSVARLNKQYRAQYGENIRHFIHKERMEQAMLLLRDRKVTVNEVADMTGYNNANNFTRSFKAYFGITPSAAWKATGNDRT